MHQPRAFSTFLSEASNFYGAVWVYSIPAAPGSWLTEVAHSPGVVGVREDLLVGPEAERMFTYENLLPFTRAIDMLMRRDLGLK